MTQDNRIMNNRPFLPPLAEYVKELESIWESRQITNMGLKHEEFTRALTEFLNVPSVSLYVNGHLALESAITALKLTGEIITTPFTFVSTTHAIVRCGLKPVFCDINPVNCTIDSSKVEDLITENTTAILPVHLYGNICDVAGIDKLAKKYHLKVLYDAAHAFGVTVNGNGIGNFGDISMFSFHATKVFHTIEGGALTYQDETLGNVLNKLKNFGIDDPETISMVGYNAKLNEFQAAMGLCNLRHHGAQVSLRKEISQRYIDHLDGIKGLTLLQDQESSDFIPNYSYFPILINEKEFGCSRNDLQLRLKQHHIYSRKYFYPLVNSLSCYPMEFNTEDTPVAKYISERVLTLPLYSELEFSDVDRICKIVLDR